MWGRRNQITDLRVLRRSLEHVSLKISSGATLESALRNNQPRVWISRSLATQWLWLREAIQAGQVPGKNGVNAFVQLLETHETCLSESRKRGLNAKIQSRVLFGVSMLVMIAIAIISDAPMWSSTNTMAATLCIIGLVALVKIEKSLSRQLWRLEWLMLWFYIKTLVECGITPAQALAQSLQWSPLSQAVPLGLRQKCTELAQAMRVGESVSIANQSVQKNRKGLESMDEDIIYAFDRAVQDGVRSSAIVEAYCTQYRKWLQDSLAEAAEKSAYLNLIPLYFCFAPAIFIVVLGPIITTYLAQG